MLSENHLSIPMFKFGMHGIMTGNTVHGILKKNNREACYDSEHHRIVVLASSDLSIDALDKMLYENESSNSYHAWYPKVLQNRDYKKNLIIQLQPDHPKKAAPSEDPSIFKDLLGTDLSKLSPEEQEKFSTQVNKRLAELLNPDNEGFRLWNPLLGGMLSDLNESGKS